MNHNISSSSIRRRWILRYGLAFVAVAAGFGLRQAFEAWVGPGLPTYITFYPAVMVAALLAGFGPGLLATVLTVVVVGYWILSPVGQFAIGSPVERLGLMLFTGMGLFMSVVAELYQRGRRKAVAYDQEMALRETLREKEFLADLLEHASQPFAVGYPDGRLGLCNRAFEQLTGYSAEELRTIDWGTKLTPPEWRELERQKLEELHRSGQPVRYEKEYIRKDGTRVPIELLVHLVKDAGGQPEYYYSFLTDITGRKRADSALQIILQRFYAVLSSMYSGVLLVTDEGRVEFANQAFCDRFGLEDKPADLMKLNSRDMIEKIKNAYLHPDEAAVRIREILDRGQAVKGEEIAMRDGGTCLRDFVPLNVQGKSYGRLWIHFDITERKWAEEALRQNETILRGILNATEESIWLFSPDGKILVGNATAFRRFGKPAEEIIGKHFSEILPAELARTRLESLRKAVDSRQSLTAEDERSGIKFHHHFHPVLDDAGRVNSIACFSRDITEHKRAEEALRVSEERLRFALETSHTGAWDLDLVDRTAFRSLEHDRIFGYPELLPKWNYEMFLEHVLPEDRAAVDGKFRRAMESHGDWNFECRIRRADGQVRWIWGAGRHRPDAAGAARRMAGIVQDITERKLAEEKLREGEERLRLTLQSSGAGVWDWDIETGGLDWSPELFQLFGLDPANGKASFESWRMVVHPADRQMAEDRIAAAVRDRVPLKNEYRIVCPTGEERWILAIGEATYDASGKPRHMMGLCLNITARKLAEEKLREGEERFRTMANAMPQLAWIARPDGHIFWYNQRWYQYSGTTPEQMEGWGWQSVHDPVELPKVLEKWKASIATGEPFEMTFPLRGADGVFRLFLTRGFPLKNAAGGVTQWFGTNTDVSELKRAEEALTSQRKELQVILESVPAMIFYKDKENHFVRTNKAFEEAMGRPKEELQGHSLFDLYPREMAEAYWNDDKNVMTSRKPRYGIVEPMQTPNGTRMVQTDKVPYFDEAGNAIGVIGFAIDITERKQTEEVLKKAHAELEVRVKERTAELRAASQYARELLEASLDPLVTISPEGKITDVNKATELVTGVARGHLIGSNFSHYFTEPEKAEEGYQQVIRDGLIRDFPLTIRHVSGRTIDVLYHATVYRNEAGAVQGVFAAARDITERKQTEMELAQYREHLEELVKQRTVELEVANAHLQTEITQRKGGEETLRQTAQELERSNRELEQFAYVASHDLQEPLRAVGGYVDLLRHRFPEKLDDKALQYIAGAASGAVRMQTLITDLLAFSRVGTQGKAFAPADLNALLARTLDNLLASIQEVHATVTSDPLPRLPVDATQIVQLFQNLIGNALKFRSERPPEVHVGVRQQPGRWLFSVRDNGIGIEPQYFQRIFQIFQRLHTRKAFPGTGIGLAICKKIVERHGGEIWVESQPDQGSTFFFTIPQISDI